MANRIKRSGEGLALQITKPARSAGLVEENNEGNATHLADVRVHSFEDLLLIVDQDTDRIPTHHVAELVASAARDTNSVFRAMNAAVQIAGNGYQVQLPPAKDANFEVGMLAPVLSAPAVLVVHREREERIANDVISIRQAQVEEDTNSD